MHVAALTRKIPVEPPAAAVEQRPAIVVLGLGNTLLGDDGAGIQVIERLRVGPKIPQGVRCLDGGTLSFSLLDEIENTTALIVVDAAQLGEAPGTVQVFKDWNMDQFLRSKHSCSVHEVSLSELLDMSRLTGHLPSRRAFVGIQPERIDWDVDVSPSVRAGLDTACTHIRALIARWSMP